MESFCWNLCLNISRRVDLKKIRECAWYYSRYLFRRLMARSRSFRPALSLFSKENTEYEVCFQIEVSLAAGDCSQTVK